MNYATTDYGYVFIERKNAVQVCRFFFINNNNSELELHSVNLSLNDIYFTIFCVFHSFMLFQFEFSKL